MIYYIGNFAFIAMYLMEFFMNTILLFLFTLVLSNRSYSFFVDDFFNWSLDNSDDQKRGFSKRKNIGMLENDNFPRDMQINPCKIDIDKNEKNQLVITLDTHGVIDAKNISTKKDARAIRIEINVENQSYALVLEENKISLAMVCEQVVRNKENTKYASSSSSMSRQEIFQNRIDLATAKMNVKKDTGLVTITAQFKDAKQENQDIDIEFE